MKIGITGAMFQSVHRWEQVDAAERFGYDGVVLPAARWTDAESWQRLKKRLADARLQIFAVDGTDAPAETSQALANALGAHVALKDRDDLLQSADGRTLGLLLRDGLRRPDGMEERRIGQGEADFTARLCALNALGYETPLIVDCQGGGRMPTRAALARASLQDVRKLLAPADDKESWLHLSPSAPGMYTVIAPDISDCRSVWIYRLNLAAGESYTLKTGGQEMNAVLIEGRANAVSPALEAELQPLDSFYLPGGHELLLTAQADSILYIGAAVCEGQGSAFFRRFDLSLPLGNIHQIHGGGSGQREVFFTLDPGVPASRLLCGITFSLDGQWTSWPPHQHERDLEEVYCYFDIPHPKFGLHLSYSHSGDVDDMAVHVVRTGTMVLAPKGYHPTVATPTMRNTYFWVLAAHSHESRRYDLAVNDSVFDQ